MEVGQLLLCCSFHPRPAHQVGGIDMVDKHSLAGSRSLTRTNPTPSMTHPVLPRRWWALTWWTTSPSRSGGPTSTCRPRASGAPSTTLPTRTTPTTCEPGWASIYGRGAVAGAVAAYHTIAPAPLVPLLLKPDLPIVACLFCPSHLSPLYTAFFQTTMRRVPLAGTPTCTC